MGREAPRWEAPVVRDYGDLRELTLAGQVCGLEDSLDKSTKFHHASTPICP